MSNTEQVRKVVGGRAGALLGEVPPELAALDGASEEERLPTLTAVGKRLPIGFADKVGGFHREFELAPWTWEVEEELGELLVQNPEMLVNEYVSEVLGRGLARLGTIEIPKLSRGERRLLVRSMYLPDVLYAYVWLRIEALGPSLKMEPFRCPHCARKIEGFAGDLRTLEVKVLDAVPRRKVTLEHGVEYGGKRLTTFELAPLRWAFMEDATPETLNNRAALKRLTLAQAVVGLEGAPEGPVLLTRDHLRTMLPREVDQLVTEVDQLGGGPVMELQGKCPACRRPFRREIDWRYGHFFAASSH
jgi:hypothetical protein